MTWRDKLRAGSFRGVPFHVQSDEGTFGRRTQIHEYPGRDKPYAEDLGRATRRYSLTAILVGSDYMERRDRFITAIETPGPGQLIHPWYGTLSVSVDGDSLRMAHSWEDGGAVRISVQFVEAGDLAFPAAAASTQDRIRSSALILNASAKASFVQQFSLGPASSSSRDSILKAVTGRMSRLTALAGAVDPALGKQMSLLTAQAGTLLTSDAGKFADQALAVYDRVEDFRKNPNLLRQQAAVLVGFAKTEAIARVSAAVINSGAGKYAGQAIAIYGQAQDYRNDPALWRRQAAGLLTMAKSEALTRVNTALMTSASDLLVARGQNAVTGLLKTAALSQVSLRLADLDVTTRVLRPARPAIGSLS